METNSIIIKVFFFELEVCNIRIHYNLEITFYSAKSEMSTGKKCRCFFFWNDFIFNSFPFEDKGFENLYLLRFFITF